MFATTTLLWLLALSVLGAAVSVGSCLKSLRMAQEARELRDEIHSLSSLDAAITEHGVLLESHRLAIRRIEGRQTGSLRANPGRAASHPPDLSNMDKAQLRAYARNVYGVKPFKITEITDVNSGDSTERVRGSEPADTSGS